MTEYSKTETESILAVPTNDEAVAWEITGRDGKHLTITNTKEIADVYAANGYPATPLVRPAPCARWDEPSSDLNILRRIADRGLLLAQKEGPAFVDLFQHMLDEIQRQPAKPSVPCARCAELEKAVAFNDETARHYLAGRTEALQKLAALEARLAVAEKLISRLEDDLISINEYWNGGNESAPDACQHCCDVSAESLVAIAAHKEGEK